MPGNQFELAEAFATLTVDDAKMKTSLRNAEKQLVDLDASMQAVSRTASLFLVGGVASIALLGRTAANAEETMSKFDAVFKDQAESVRAWADEIAEATGRSTFAIQGFLAQLQDTFVPLGFTRDRAAELSKEMTQLAIDLGSFNNMAEPEVINLLNSALVGNHEAVRRFGIIITEATLKQELMNMGMAKATGQALELAKVQARLNIIMRSTTDAQGDAARTADSTANQMRALRSEFEAFAVEMGQLFLPAIRDIIAAASALLKMFREMTDAQKKQVAAFITTALEIAALIVVVNKFNKMIGIATKSVQLFQQTFAKSPLGLLVSVLVAAGIAIYNFATAVGTADDAAKKMNETQKEATRQAKKREAAELKLAAAISKVAEGQTKATTALDEFLKKSEDILKTEEERAREKDPVQQGKKAISQGKAQIQQLDKERELLEKKRQEKAKKAAQQEAEYKAEAEAIAIRKKRFGPEAEKEAKRASQQGLGMAAVQGGVFAPMTVAVEAERQMQELKRKEAEREAIIAAEKELEAKKKIVETAKEEQKQAEEALKENIKQRQKIDQDSIEAQKRIGELEEKSQEEQEKALDELKSKTIQEGMTAAMGKAEEDIKSESRGLQRMQMSGLQDFLQDELNREEDKMINLAEKAAKQRDETNRLLKEGALKRGAALFA